ncbi:glycine cleavage system protein GcvH [Thermoproteota archaeon]
MNMPDNLLYTKEHEWVKIEGSQATIGISDHAQSSLGGITFVECPTIGQECQQFKQLATVESVKAASDIYAPLSGKVLKVNEELSSNPELINQFPYENGWLVVIEIADGKETENLLSSAAYKKYLEGLS